VAGAAVGAAVAAAVVAAGAAVVLAGAAVVAAVPQAERSIPASMTILNTKYTLFCFIFSSLRKILGLKGKFQYAKKQSQTPCLLKITYLSSTKNETDPITYLRLIHINPLISLCQLFVRIL
jgi:hypothetical protein